MPTVTRETIGLLNDKITVTVSKDDYLPSFEKAIRQYAKSANIPGFRKGMVPPGMIRKMHGNAVFTEEVLKRIEKELMDYLRKEQLDIFAQPLPAAGHTMADINVQQTVDYSLAFEIGLKPGFELPDLKSLSPKKYKVTVTDEMIDEEINRLQQRHGNMTEPEKLEQEEDILNLSFESQVAAETEGERPAPKTNSLLLKYFSPAFRPQLIGAKKGDQFDIVLDEAFEEKERAWLIQDLGLPADDPASAKAAFRIQIDKLGRIEKRESGKEFFDLVYPGKGIETEADFRAEIRRNMEAYWEAQSSRHLQHELYHVLNEQTQMDFPDEFLRRWMRTGGEHPKTEEEVEKEFPEFRNQLRWMLISDRIVHDQNLHVNREEIAAHMRDQLLSYLGSMNMGGNPDWLDSYVDRMLKDEQQVESAYRKIIAEKILIWAESQVAPDISEIGTAEFLELQHKH